MNAVRLAGGVTVVTMVAVIVWAWAQTPIGDDFAVIVERPWGVVSLVDLYLGLALAAVWVAYRESRPWRTAVWVLALAALGNLALGAYVVVAATQGIRAGSVDVLIKGLHPG